MAASERDKLTADLSAYLDGELPPERARKIEKLLARSQDARRTLEQLRQVSGQLASLPRWPAPDQLTAAIRRHAERRELLDQKHPAGHGRILPLFVRLSAAAAVLIGCVLVGRHMLTRDRQQPEPATPLTTAPPRTVDEGQRLATAKKLHEEEKSDLPKIHKAPTAAGPTPTDTLALDTVEPPTTGDTVGMVAGRPVETQRLPAAASPQSAPSFGYSTIARGGTTMEALDADDVYFMGASQADKRAALYGIEPSVDVLITPQNREQYAAVCVALAEWSADHRYVEAAATANLGLQAGLRVEQESQTSDLNGRGPPPSEAHMTGQISAANVTTLIEYLDQQAPQQVHFELRGSRVDLLRKLAQPAEDGFGPAAPRKGVAETTEQSEQILARAEVKDTDEDLREPSVGREAAVERALIGGAGQPPREGVRARGAGKAERRVTEGSESARAGRRGGVGGRDYDRVERKPRAEQPRRARPAAKGAGRARIPQTAEPVSPSIAIDESAEAPPTREPKQPTTQATTQPSQPPPTSAEAVRRLGGRYILGSPREAAPGAEKEEPRAVPDAVTLRVTLLPPPAAASQPHTRAGPRPTTAPASQPAPPP